MFNPHVRSVDKWIFAIGLFTLSSLHAAEPTVPDLTSIESISVEPSRVQLVGEDAVRGLLVHGTDNRGRVVDLTHQANYKASAKFMEVSKAGIVKALGDGSGKVHVSIGRHHVTVHVSARETKKRREYHFENDVVPILSKHACNTSGCHGKAEGQNGFKLSVFGFDPEADYNALVKEGRGRRVFLAAPERSLLLAKASGGVPHGGGIRFFPDSYEYKRLHGWIASGAPMGSLDAAHVTAIEIRPPERIMDPLARQQLRVVARYSNGATVDVTHMAKYQSNNEGLATVDEAGRVQIGPVPGQVAVMATFMGAVDTFEALIPRQIEIKRFPSLVEKNFIDTLVHARLKKLNLLPSEVCDDAEFLRRAYLSIIGTLPRPKEAKAFLNDGAADKRTNLVDELLERSEYADYWALKWADLLRVDRKALGHRQAHEYYNWIRAKVEENEGMDQFVREIVTVKGNLKDAPQASFYRVVGNAGEQANAISQVFLGVRIACAQCHHHPFDRWSQRDYYGMSALFSQVKRKSTSRGEFMTAAGDPVTKHPRSGERVFAHPLGEAMPAKSPEGDWREGLAAWMIDRDNPWFARATVNRVWAHLMGRGLVEPVDDFRDTNPPTNPDLLDALAKSFVDSRFDMKQLIRTICASNAFQRSSKPNETNAEDEQNYSRALLKRVDAEVLFDAITDVTGVTEKFRGVPDGHRAIQLWDSDVEHYFLKLFGRPTRKTACECERVGEPNVSQVLHVLNSPEIHAKLSHDGGRVAKLEARLKQNTELVDELYLTFFSRYPNSDERKVAEKYLDNASEGRRAAAEDLAWSLMNSLEFIFNH